MSRQLIRACWGTALLVHVVVAQQCYYPNGSEAPEKPCSSAEGSACCPDKWECLDNGLCHYEPDNLFGRYSCTDQSWDAPGCPTNLCTYDMSAAGGESITQCSNHDNQWCCNADATHVNCCQESPEPRPFFNLQDGRAYATVGASTASAAPTLATITGSALGDSNGPASTNPPSSAPRSSGSPSSPSSSPEASKEDVSSAPTPTTPVTPITSVQTSVSSGTNGIQTLVITSIITPAASTSTSTPSSPSTTSSKLPIIIGCAVGIPLALALLGILIWLLRKRRNAKKSPYAEHDHLGDSPGMSHTNGSTNGFIGGAAAKLGKKNKRESAYKHEHGNENVAELPGTGIGPGRPVSNIPGKAELDSGAGFAPGRIPYGPNAVGLGGGNGNGNTFAQTHTPQASWGSAPPGYSPGMNQQQWEQGGGQQQQPAELPNTNVQPTATGGYIPYRPPGSQQHLGGVPEAAELSTVTTPPAAELSTVTTPPVAELGTVKTPPA